MGLAASVVTGSASGGVSSVAGTSLLPLPSHVTTDDFNDRTASFQGLLPYAHMLAGGVASRCAPAELADLRVVAESALWLACCRWDSTRGVKLITYAHRYVMGACRRYLRDCSALVRVPAYQWGRVAVAVVSADDIDAMACPGVTPHAALESSELCRAVAAAIAAVTQSPDVQRWLYARLLQGRTYADIGRAEGVCPVAVRCACVRALPHVRAWLVAHGWGIE